MTAARDLVGRAATTMCVSGLSIALLTLWRIGPPPAFRIDVLWVHRHQPLVELMLLGVAAALVATGTALLIGRGRAAAALLWALAVALAGAQFPDRLEIICRILLERTLEAAPG